jgi:hypothetical protein
MPTIIAHHQVKDTQDWLASSKRAEALGRLGASNIRTFVDQGDPQHVSVLMDVADLSVLLGALDTQDPALVASMQDDGVLPATLSILIES